MAELLTNFAFLSIKSCADRHPPPSTAQSCRSLESRLGRDFKTRPSLRIRRSFIRHCALTALSLLVLVGRIGAQKASSSVPLRPITTDSASILRAQLEVMRQSEQNLLTTVLWSLSLVGGVTVVLIGYNWFAVQRAYDRDKLAIRSQLLGELATESGKLRSELSERLEELNRSLDGVAAESAERVVSKATSRISALGRRVDELEVEQLKAKVVASEEAELWFSALLARIELLRRYLETGEEYYVGPQLEGLAAMLRKGFHPDADEAARIVAALEKVPPKFAPDVEALRNAVKAARAAG